MPDIQQLKNFTGRFSLKPDLTSLLIPPHLKYVTTVPCNLSLITALVCDCRSFSDVNDVLRLEMLKNMYFLWMNYFMKYFSIFCVLFERFEKKSSNKSWVLFSQGGNAFVQIIA